MDLKLISYFYSYFFLSFLFFLGFTSSSLSYHHSYHPHLFFFVAYLDCASLSELIITEKHHCLTLKIMQKIYAQGMIKELHMTKDMVERIFPCLEDLLETHLTFLKKLRERQSLDSVIDSIGDIILQQVKFRLRMSI